jgi:hypothetical protein
MTPVLLLLLLMDGPTLNIPPTNGAANAKINSEQFGLIG